MIDANNIIDYSKISAAISHYDRVGYEYMEVPWLVSAQSIDVTRPPWASSLEAVTHGSRGFSWGHLVGSGEQSFIEVRNKGDLLIGARRCCATPCFRDERVVDRLHRQYFFKVELIEVVHPKDDCVLALNRMISIAEDFFSIYVPVRRIRTDEGFDLQLHLGKAPGQPPPEPLELGSYGIREIKGHSQDALGRQGFKWIYGTGCAEPRLTQAVLIEEEMINERKRSLKEHERCRLESGSSNAPRRHKKASR